MIRESLVSAKSHIEDCIDYYMWDELNNIERIEMLKEMRNTIWWIVNEIDKATQN